MQSRGTIVTDDKLRIADIMMHKANQDNRWIFDRVVGAFETANRDAYNFELDGFNVFQYSEYNDKGAHYEYHMDVSFASVNDRFIIGRKLSLSIMLNDQSEFTGGEFQMIIDSQTMEKPITVPHKRGRFVFFPAFIVHRVAPVHTGTRRSLVFWALGPQVQITKLKQTSMPCRCSTAGVSESDPVGQRGHHFRHCLHGQTGG